MIAKIRKICIVCFLFMVFLKGTEAFANQDEQNVKNAITMSGGPFDMVAEFKNNPKEARDKFMHWGLKNPSQIPPIYFIAFADEYFNRDKVRAVYLYMLGKLRSTEDVMMCEDITARGQMGAYPSFAPLTVDLISKLSKEEQKSIFDLALQWDKTHPDRVSPKWACYHGFQAFYRDVEVMPAENFSKVQKKVRKQMTKELKQQF